MQVAVALFVIGACVVTFPQHQSERIAHAYVGPPISLFFLTELTTNQKCSSVVGFILPRYTPVDMQGLFLFRHYLRTNPSPTRFGVDDVENLRVLPRTRAPERLSGGASVA